MVRIEVPFVCLPRDHSAKNAQKCLEMLINEMQRRNGKRARAKTLRDVARRVNEGASKFW